MNNGMPPGPQTGMYDELDPATGLPPTSPTMPAADPNLYAAADQAATMDPMAAETGMTRSAWSTALHEGMAGGKGIREIMAEFNPGMYGRYTGQQAPAAPPQNPYMPAGMPGAAQTHTMPDGSQMAGPPMGGGANVGQFGMGTAGMAPPAAAPPGFPPAPAQGMRPGPLGRLQQRTRPAAPGQQPPSRRSRKNSRGH